MPSRKIITIGIICFAIVVSVAIFEWRTNKNANASSEPTVVANNTNVANTADTDWQHILWTAEGSTTDITSAGLGSTTIDTNLTSQMAKDFFSQYMSLQDSSGNVSSDDANQIAENTLTSGAYLNAQGKQYASADLHITNSTTKQTYEAYHDSLEKVASKSHLANEEPIAIVANALQTGNDADLKGLDPIISDYTALIKGFLAMNVPSDAVAIHLQMLNSYSNLLSNVQSFKDFINDPVKGLPVLKEYPANVYTLKLTIQQLQSYFAEKQMTLN